MNYQTMQKNAILAYKSISIKRTVANSNMVSCDWYALCEQLLQQWDKLSAYELEATGHNRYRIANLIQHKYGIPAEMAENYLYNFERTLPLLNCA